MSIQLVEQCLAAGVCVDWDDRVQFWELGATVIVTALVAGLTVLISVREARRATQRQLDADALARAVERADLATQRRAQDADALAKGMTDKAAEFVAAGGEIYRKA